MRRYVFTTPDGNATTLELPQVFSAAGEVKAVRAFCRGMAFATAHRLDPGQAEAMNREEADLMVHRLRTGEAST